MLSVAEAQALVLPRARPLPPVAMPLVDAFGRVLAEDVASDLDMPPHDKALMDGFAVRCTDLPGGRGELAIIEEITAGRVPRLPLAAGQAARIMTGAPIPAGADAVVMVERTRPLERDRVQIDDPGLEPERNVLRRGREMRRGEVVLQAGGVLRPQEIGLLASMGRTTVRAHPLPEVAVLVTGDELVETALTPGPGQIRNSNGPMILAQVARAGGRPIDLGIGRDRVDSLRLLVEKGLRSAVLILSGGVSAGKLDLVPEVLQEAGVEAHFHKVEMKPGKPVFFGTRGDTLVFGLPGNPVSSLVCFELFARTAIRRLGGHKESGPPIVLAALASDFAHRSDRPTYHPAWLEMVELGWQVLPVPWFGSSDLRGLVKANAIVVLPAGEQRFRAGEYFTVLRIEM